VDADQLHAPALQLLADEPVQALVVLRNDRGHGSIEKREARSERRVGLRSERREARGERRVGNRSRSERREARGERRETGRAQKREA
jgi:hypothetical protein